MVVLSHGHINVFVMSYFRNRLSHCYAINSNSHNVQIFIFILDLDSVSLFAFVLPAKMLTLNKGVIGGYI